MKQLVILSGKGGTGKTTISAAMAHLASLEREIVLADADVDAANLELLLQSERVEQHEFHAGEIAEIDSAECIACGECAQVCRFGALVPGETYAVDPVSCEGCAACFYQCPVEAIRMQIRHAGMWYRSDSRFGPLFHAHLFAGEENSGKLVTQVKQASTRWAADHGRELVLVDGPPGIGCTVISASSGADLALLVTEPTVSGSHDLDRVLATTDHFGVPAIACINKWDINSERSAEIRASCEARGIPVVGMIPFDIVVVKALVQREPVTIYAPEKVVSRHLADMWTSVAQTLEKERPEATRAGQLPTA